MDTQGIWLSEDGAGTDKLPELRPSCNMMDWSALSSSGGVFPGLAESFSVVSGDCLLPMCLASSPLPSCSGALFILSNGTLVSFSFSLASQYRL